MSSDQKHNKGKQPVREGQGIVRDLDAELEHGYELREGPQHSFQYNTADNEEGHNEMDYQGNVQYINEYNVEEGYPNSNEEITGEIITPRNGLTVHELIEEFHSITNMELDDCARLLERAKWNLEVATEMYFDHMSGFPIEGPLNKDQTEEDHYLEYMLSNREGIVERESIPKKKDKGKQPAVSEGAPDKGKRPISTYRSDYYNNSEDYDNNKYSRRGRNSEDEADDERDRQMQPPVQFVKYTAEDAPTLSGSEIAMFQEITGESQDEAEKYLKHANWDIERAVQLYYEYTYAPPRSPNNESEYYSDNNSAIVPYNNNDNHIYYNDNQARYFNHNNPHVTANFNGPDTDQPTYSLNDFKLVKPAEPCSNCQRATSSIYKHTTEPLCWSPHCKHLYHTQIQRVPSLSEITLASLLGRFLRAEDLFKLLPKSASFPNPSVQQWILQTVLDNFPYLEQHPGYTTLPAHITKLIDAFRHPPHNNWD